MTTVRTITRHRTRRAILATRVPISIPRDHCFYCGGFPAVVTTHGTEFCPVCYGSGVE